MLYCALLCSRPLVRSVEDDSLYLYHLVSRTRSSTSSSPNPNPPQKTKHDVLKNVCNPKPKSLSPKNPTPTNISCLKYQPHATLIPKP